MQVLSEGQYIRHGQYGMGVVTESNSERTTVQFADHGVRKFVTSIWTAEIVGEPAKPIRRRGMSRARKTPKALVKTAGK